MFWLLLDLPFRQSKGEASFQGTFLVPKFQGISFFAEEHEYIHGIYLVYTA